jgi:protein SCO1/2/putative membrane protein
MTLDTAPEPSPAESARHRLVWASLIVVILGVFAAAGVNRYNREARKLPLSGPVGEFKLVDHRGQAISDKSLRGRVWIASFIFTRCAGTCVYITGSVHTLDQKLIDLPDVELVSFSMDPEFDTQDVLSRYARERNLESPRWHFVTGNKDEIFRMTRDKFQMAVKEGNSDKNEQILHSSHLVLVDRSGQIRGYYTGVDPDGVNALLHDTRVLEGALDVRMLPTVNATLNSICTVVLLLGYYFIRKKRVIAHQTAMITAGALSALFLGCYLFYHYQVGHVEFTHEGWIRSVYRGILLSHVLLAFSIAILVPLTFARALRNDIERHRRIARITFPIWMYVSVTGVVVYLMLYHM